MHEILTSLPTVPITRKFPVPDVSNQIQNPGLARVNRSVDVNHPQGSPEEDFTKTRIFPDTQSVVEQHVAFFDRDGDGIISPWDTLMSFRDLGFNWLYCLGGMLVIHGCFFLWVHEGFWPDLFFRLPLKQMWKGKHGSDSNVLDHQGRFSPQHFEEIFSKYSTDGLSLTIKDLWKMLRGQMLIFDFMGVFAFLVEWITLYLLCAKRGRIPKEAIRRNYDGTLFYQISREVALKRKFGRPYEIASNLSDYLPSAERGENVQ